MVKLETESQLQSSGENLSPLEAQCHIVEDHLCTTAAYSHCLCSFSSGCGHSCKVPIFISSSWVLFEKRGESASLNEKLSLCHISMACGYFFKTLQFDCHTPSLIKHICTRGGGEPEYGIRIGANIPYVCVAHLRCSPVGLKGCQPKKCKAGASEDPAWCQDKIWMGWLLWKDWRYCPVGFHQDAPAPALQRTGWLQY